MGRISRDQLYRRVFWWALGCELVLYLLWLILFNAGVPIGGFVGWFIIAGGLAFGALVCIAGLFLKAVRKPALLLLAVHAALPWINYPSRWLLYRHIRSGVAERERFHAFETLVASGRWDDSLTYLDEHEPVAFRYLERLTAVFCAMGEQEYPASFLQLMRDKAQLSPGDELRAASSCSAKITKDLIKGGTDPDEYDSDNKTALMTGTNVDALRVLLEYGADVNAVSRDTRASTPVTFHRNPGVTLLLLENGADANKTDRFGESALHQYAAVDGLAECYEFLLEAGADPNLLDHDSEAPLLELSLHWDYRAANVLVAHGADPHVREPDQGYTPLEAAIREIDATNLTWPGLELEGPYGARLLREAQYSHAWATFDALLEAGANPVLPDKDGKSTLDTFVVPDTSWPQEDVSRYERLRAAAARFQSTR